MKHSAPLWACFKVIGAFCPAKLAGHFGRVSRQAWLNPAMPAITASTAYKQQAMIDITGL